MVIKAWFFAVFVAVAPVALQAWELCCPKDWCFNVSAGGEALYWQPCTDDFVYGRQFTSGTESVALLLALEPEYNWGYRIFSTISDECDCNSIDVEWAHVNNNSERIDGVIPGFELQFFPFDGGVPEAVSTLFLKGDQKTRYEKVSARLNHHFFDCCCRYVYGYLGGRWVHIQMKQSVSLVDPGAPVVTLVRQKTSFDGWGVEAGVGAYTDLWKGLGTSIRFGGIGVCGNRAFTLSPDGVPDTSLSNTKHRCIGAFEVRADVHLTCDCGCFWVRGNVSYELDYYLSALLFGRGESLPSNLFASDFGMGGLVLGLTVGY